jgi:hypothetical protein
MLIILINKGFRVLSKEFSIVNTEEPTLMGKGGCWGIVNHVGEFSCTVTMWDGEYTIRIDQLKRPYLTAVEEKLLGVIEKEYGVTD